jgi:hypothetical protein
VDGPAVCKGSCFALVQTSSVGLCGSFINLLHGQRCPDEPDRITPIYPAAGDDLGLCVFKSCGTDRECQAPFKCLTGPAGNMVCTL